MSITMNPALSKSAFHFSEGDSGIPAVGIIRRVHHVLEALEAIGNAYGEEAAQYIYDSGGMSPEEMSDTVNRIMLELIQPDEECTEGISLI